MRKLNVFGLIVLVFCLALAGGCSKKVGSTPAGGMGAGSDSMSGQGGMGGDMDSQRLMEMQRQAIEKISANRIYFAFDSNELSQESRQILTL